MLKNTMDSLDEDEGTCFHPSCFQALSIITEIERYYICGFFN